DEDMADTFAGKAAAFIEQNKDRRFFLYFSPHDIHEPMAPNARFRGTSNCGVRGDAIHELDWCVGEIVAALDRAGVADNTLLVFSSDNGGAIKNTYDDGTNAEHARQPPNGVLRGEKGRLYEGGHRVPLIARWPGHIAPGSTSNALVGLVDMMATFSAAAGRDIEGDAGPDSLNQLPVFLGEKTEQPIRDRLVLHTNGDGPLGLRLGPWMLVTHKRNVTKNAELYNLDDDLAETTDLAAKHPDKLNELAAELGRLQNGARSRP
ncbi:MAG: hypothetical protein QG656_2352, partial [Candidatus Hydrogenedentes bacterium]|nr:hypothetical protein [Candidatus Hydrogenedentota bacterium]